MFGLQFTLYLTVFDLLSFYVSARLSPNLDRAQRELMTDLRRNNWSGLNHCDAIFAELIFAKLMEVVCNHSVVAHYEIVV